MGFYLPRMSAEGFLEQRMTLRRSVDCRYQGQSFELTVPLAVGPIDAGALAALAESFGQGRAAIFTQQVRRALAGAVGR